MTTFETAALPARAATMTSSQTEPEVQPEMTYAQLADAALGAPDLTIINFNMLYGLIRSLLARFGIGDALISVPVEFVQQRAEVVASAAAKSPFYTTPYEPPSPGPSIRVDETQSDADSGVLDVMAAMTKTKKAAPSKIGKGGGGGGPASIIGK